MMQDILIFIKKYQNIGNALSYCSMVQCYQLGLIVVIAEQFGTLESLYPGRIDLGLG
jgi:hypothetical protein